MAVLVCLLPLLLVGCAHSAVPYALPEERWMGQQLSEPVPVMQDAYQQESNNLQDIDLSLTSVQVMGLEECLKEVSAKGLHGVSSDCQEMLRSCLLDYEKFGRVPDKVCAEILKIVLGDFGMGSHQCGSHLPKVTSDHKSSTPQYFNTKFFSTDQTYKNALEILTLPIGQGDCTVIYCPGGKRAVLFDCGSTGGRDHGFSPENVALFFRNVNHITIILSHGDQDHYNYLPRVFEDSLLRQKVTRVYLGGPESDYACKRCGIKELFKALKQLGKKVESLRPSNIDMCGNEAIHFNIIAAGMGTKKNEKSVVMKLHMDGCESSLLFTGDMEGKAAEQLVASKADLRSTHYKVAHHGASRDANSEVWLRAISPDEAHFSHSYNGRYGHPRCNAVSRLMSIGTTQSVGHTFSCVEENRQISGTKNDCRRLFSTSPAAGGMCVINLTFLPGSPATTTTFCDYAPNWNIAVTPEVPIDEDEED